MRVQNIETDGFTQDYSGYDMLIFANLSSQTIANPMLGVGGALSPTGSWTVSSTSSSNPIYGVGGVLNPLLIGGYANNPIFGGSGPQKLADLAAGEIYVMLVPHTAESFNAAGTAADGQKMVITADLEDQQLTYMVDPSIKPVSTTLATVDQVFSPQGPSLGGVTWQTLGTYTSTTGTIRVAISNADTGNAVADGIEVVRQGSVMPDLLQLNLQGDPLGNDARDFQVGTLAAEIQSRVSNAPSTTIPETVLYESDANPPTLTAQGPVSLPSGQISTTVTLAADEPVTFSAQSGDAHVTVSISGDVLTLTPNEPGFKGTVPILVTATDPYGRTARESFDFNVDIGAIYGTITPSTDSDPQQFEGVTVFLDTNGNGLLDPGEPTTITDANGDYSFTNLPPGTANVAAVVANDASSQVTFLLSSQGSQGSDPSSLISFDNAVYFVADDGLTGQQLWRFDGTNTTRITDITAGPYGSEFENMMVVGSDLYFTAYDGSTSWLYQYDGSRLTQVTTSKAGGANPYDLTVLNGVLYFIGHDNSDDSWLYEYNGTALTQVTTSASGVSYPYDLTVMNGALYFIGYGGDGNGLYEYDGTKLTQVNTSGLGITYPYQLFADDDTLYFAGYDSNFDSWLYKYDGTSATPVTTSASGGSDPQDFTDVNGDLYFEGHDSSGSLWLYEYNGTSVTQVPGATLDANSAPEFFALNGILYFAGEDSNGKEWLYEYDGTNVTPVTTAASGGSDPSNLFAFDGALYFEGKDSNGELLLYEYQATGVTPVTTDASGTYPGDLTIFDGDLYFGGYGNDGGGLYKYDGTKLTQVTNITTGGIFTYDLTIVDGTLYFSGWGESTGYELWSYHGTDTTASLVADVNVQQAQPADMAVFNGSLYLVEDGAYGNSLYQTNGTGTSIVSDSETGATVEGPSQLTVVSSTLLAFEAQDNSGYEWLYTYDGTHINQVTSPTLGGSNPVILDVIDGVVYFSADDSNGISWLYSYDGNNLTQVTNSMSGGSSPSAPIAVGNVIYFSAEDSSGDSLLYEYDGTMATPVTSIANGGSSPTDLVNLDGVLYFLGLDDNDSGWLYSYDGSNLLQVAPYSSGPTNYGQLVVDGSTLFFTDEDSDGVNWLYEVIDGAVSPVTSVATGGSTPTDLTVLNGILYFVAQDNTLTDYLFEYDGNKVTQITSSNLGSSPMDLTSFAGDLFFVAADSTRGEELWKYDGTTADQLLDINPGPATSEISDFTVVGNELDFAVTSVADGVEIWRTDGVDVHLVTDLDPGDIGSGVSDLTPYDGSLYYVVRDTLGNDELWRTLNFVGPVSVAVQTDQPTTGVDMGPARVLSVGPDEIVNEDTPVTLTASFNDGSSTTGRTFTYLWQVTSNNGQVISGGTGSSFTFTPDDNGPNDILGDYVVTLTETVTNSAGSMQTYTDSATILVKDVPPTVGLGPNQTVSEGTAVNLVASYSDPGPLDVPLSYAWQVTNSAGQVVATATTTSPDYSFTPATFGTYTATVTVANKDASGTAQATITATDVAPVVSLPSTASLDEGVVFAESGSFSDPGTDTWTATIDFGDGSGPQPLALEGNQFSLSHVYALEPAPYTVTVVIHDNGGASGSEQTAVTIVNEPPVVSISYPTTGGGTSSNPTIAADAGQVITLAGSYTDLYANDAPFKFDWHVTSTNGQVVSDGTNSTFSFVPAENGDYTVTFTVTNNYGSAGSTSTTIIVDKTTPTITWSNPADITYGTTLGATQLDAMASVSGTFTYTPAAGTILDAGPGQILTATFTPDDTTDYNSTVVSVVVNVNQATPVITLPNPADIIYGTALGAAQLDATSSVPGTFTYTPAAGVVLKSGRGQTLSVSFSPTDSADYTDISSSATINVDQATPTISWASPADITYGTALGTAQLDATASVPGTLTYSPALGAVLKAGAGQTLSVSFTPTDSTDYSSISATTTINVDQATPTISWPDPADIAYGTALGATQLDAIPSVPGVLSYVPAAGAILKVGENQILSVSFTPIDSTDYTSISATTMVNVDRATPTISWPDPADITYGTALGATQLDAIPSVPGVLSYVPAAGAVLKAGKGQILSVSFTPTDSTDYTSISATTTINVDQVTPTITWANPTNIVYGTVLSSTQLDATATWTVDGANESLAGTLTYTPAVGTVLGVGNKTLSVTFTPTDTTDFLTVSATVTIDVTSSTAFVKKDTTTQGNWQGIYGAQGYDLVGGPSSLPSYVTVTPSNELEYTWTTTSTDPRALQLPGSSNRIAAVWYSSTSFTVAVNLSDGQTHDLELYFDDWDNKGRAETVQISTPSGTLLSTESISSFANGVYLGWQVTGNIMITITNTAGQNAVLNGLFVERDDPRREIHQVGYDDAWHLGERVRGAGLRYRGRPFQPALLRHRQALGRIGIYLDHHIDGAASLAIARLDQSHRGRLVLRDELQRQRGPDRRAGARPGALFRRLGQQGTGRESADQHRLGHRSVNREHLIVRKRCVPELASDGRRGDHDHRHGRSERGAQRRFPRPDDLDRQFHRVGYDDARDLGEHLRGARLRDRGRPVQPTLLRHRHALGRIGTYLDHHLDRLPCLAGARLNQPNRGLLVLGHQFHRLRGPDGWPGP